MRYQTTFFCIRINSLPNFLVAGIIVYLPQMLYSYGSCLSKITLSLLCIVVPVTYLSINPLKKNEMQVVYLIQSKY